MNAPLYRFAILVGAMVLIPWLATVRPEWGGWDSGWVQAWGSIGAILVGFAYVAVQDHLQLQRERRRQRDLRRFYVEVVAEAIAGMDRTLKQANAANQTKRTLVATAQRDAIEVLSDEMLTVTPTTAGSIKFALELRLIAVNLVRFSHRVRSIAADTLVPTSGDIAYLTGRRDSVDRAKQRMLTSL